MVRAPGCGPGSRGFESPHPPHNSKYLRRYLRRQAAKSWDFVGQAVGIALFSYHGGLFWGVNADRELVPDLDLLVAALAREFQELRKAVDQDRDKLASG